MSADEGSIPQSSESEFDDDEREVTLGTAVIEIIRGDPKRLHATIMNRSDTPVFISTKETVSITTGFRLEANSGSLELTRQKHRSLVTKAWYGITSAASKVVVVVEGFRN